jgi:DNA-binding IclR family transcriptional regulator
MRTLETVDRALRMLQLFDHAGQEMTVSALAAGLGMHRSSASRFAATLAERGFLERATGGEAFRLGPEIGRLGMLSIADRDLVTDAQPVMQRLAERTGETVVLSVLDQGEALNIAQADGAYLVGTRKWKGRRATLHSSSDGKVFLAFADVDPTARAMLPPPADTIARKKELSAEIEQVRHQGWAASRGELEEGLHGVAVPVRDHLGRCVAALSVSGPDYRLPTERLHEVAAVVTEAAEEISTRLGYAAPRIE